MHWIAAHMIVGENLHIAERFLKDCLESLKSVEAVTVGIHPRCSKEVREVLLHYCGDVVTEVFALDGDSFSDWRNQLLDRGVESQYVLRADADMYYDVETINELYDIAAEGLVDIVYSPMIHLMRTPWERQVEGIGLEPTLLRRKGRWTKSVHEYMPEVRDSDYRYDSKNGFTHWGYVKPQISTFLKWCLYALLEHGNLDTYKSLFKDGVTPLNFLNDREVEQYEIDKSKFPNIFEKHEEGDMWENYLKTTDPELYEWYDKKIHEAGHDYSRFVGLLEQPENWPKRW